jgi:chromate transport protein ChrA
VAALVLLWRFKVPEPILIIGAGLIGFAIFWLRGVA